MKWKQTGIGYKQQYLLFLVSGNFETTSQHKLSNIQTAYQLPSLTAKRLITEKQILNFTVIIDNVL